MVAFLLFLLIIKSLLRGSFFLFFFFPAALTGSCREGQEKLHPVRGEEEEECPRVAPAAGLWRRFPSSSVPIPTVSMTISRPP